MQISRSQGNLKKIWFAMSTPFQVNFFYPLIKRLETRFEILITARSHDRIFSTLKAKGLDYIPVGKHGGHELMGKLESYADTVKQLAPLIQHEKPDLLLTERWPEAVRVAFGFDIPSWTLFYDEREHHVNKMVFPLSSLIFSPRFYNSSELRENGVTELERVVWFDGFHACYLKDETFQNKNPFRERGIRAPVVLVRPEPEFATYFGQKKNILEDVVQNLNGHAGSPSVVVLPRTEAQADRYKRMNSIVLNDSLTDNPVAHSDVVIGAAETMLMESFVMGTPTISSIYWSESKPVAELHKYVPHITDAEQATNRIRSFLDRDERTQFMERSRRVVDQMENPIQKILDEISKRYLPKERKSRLGRRSRLEIYMDVITVTGLQPMRLISIMQSANLSHSEAKKSVSYLTRKGFIVERPDRSGGSYYKATVEGLNLCRNYDSLRERLID